MCEPTFPVFREGVIVSLSLPRTSEQTLSLAETFRRNDRAESFLVGLSDIIESKFDAQDFSIISEEPALRFFPSIVVDYPSLRYTLKGELMDTRVGFTICKGDKKIKIWSRTSFVNIQESSKRISQFFDDFVESNDSIMEYCFNYYNKTVLEFMPEQVLKPEYKILMKFVSSTDERISKLIRTKIYSNSDTVLLEDNKTIVTAFDLLNNAMIDATGEVIDKSEGSERRFLGIKELRRIDIAEHVGISSLESPEELDGICVVDIEDGFAQITGVGYEAQVPQKYKKSVSHILSAEVSVSVGQLY